MDQPVGWRTRRPKPRFDFETTVTFTPFGTEDSFVATSLNVSETGMMLRSEKPVETDLILQFMTPTFAGECRVPWSHQAEDGALVFSIQFVSLGPRATEELKKLLLGLANAPRLL